MVTMWIVSRVPVILEEDGTGDMIVMEVCVFLILNRT